MPNAIRLALLAPLLAACSTAGIAVGDGGIPFGDASTACPSSAPTNGARCTIPAGTSTLVCYYSASGGTCSGGTSAQCIGGQWTVTDLGGPPEPLACPVNVPSQGSACTPSCGGAQQSCTYPCGTAGGPAMAFCTGGSWNVQPLQTTCPRDAGVDSSVRGLRRRPVHRRCGG